MIINAEVFIKNNLYCSTDMAFYMVIYTPKAAKWFLENCGQMNRIINRQTVLSYKRQMEQGLWDCENGQVVKFTKSGWMFDFHHRMLAIAESGQTYVLPTLVGCSENAFATTDTGHSRTSKDAMSIFLAQSGWDEKEIHAKCGTISKIIHTAINIGEGKPTEHGNASTRVVSNNEERFNFFLTNERTILSIIDLWFGKKRGEGWKNCTLATSKVLKYNQLLLGLAIHLLTNGVEWDDVLGFFGTLFSEEYSKIQATKELVRYLPYINSKKNTMQTYWNIYAYTWNKYYQNEHLRLDKRYYEKSVITPLTPEMLRGC